jgi:hypothetical protein
MAVASIGVLGIVGASSADAAATCGKAVYDSNRGTAVDTCTKGPGQVRFRVECGITPWPTTGHWTQWYDVPKYGASFAVPVGCVDLLDSVQSVSAQTR